VVAVAVVLALAVVVVVVAEGRRDGERGGGGEQRGGPEDGSHGRPPRLGRSASERRRPRWSTGSRAADRARNPASGCSAPPAGPGAIVPARRGDPPMAVQNETRKAFHELLDLLREVDERFLGPEWMIQSSQDVADGMRAVLHMLQGALVGHFEDDPEHPRFRR